MDQVKLNGELTIATAEELVTTLLQALRSQQKLIIDLTAVERIDTSAAQVLLSAALLARRNATSVVFNCSAAVNERLQRIGIQL